MSWDQRGQRRYFYRHQRVNGQPRRVYVGTGPAADLAAAADAVLRLQQEIESREQQAEQARHEEALAPLLELCEGTDGLMEATLLVAGFHQHAHGAWRRRSEQERAD